MATVTRKTIYPNGPVTVATNPEGQVALIVRGVEVTMTPGEAVLLSIILKDSAKACKDGA